MVDYLDSMAWDIAISAALIGIAAIKLRYKASSDSVEAENRNLRMGLAVGLGGSGLYLAITGIGISLTGPLAGGADTYNILFGGVAGLGGLVILATSVALFMNASLKPVSYFAAVVGLYILVDAVAIIYPPGLTKASGRNLAFLAYLASAVASFLTIPATHSDKKWVRYLFAVFAFLFALAWLVEGALFTLGHLGVITT